MSDRLTCLCKKGCRSKGCVLLFLLRDVEEVTAIPGANCEDVQLKCILCIAVSFAKCCGSNGRERIVLLEDPAGVNALCVRVFLCDRVVGYVT